MATTTFTVSNKLVVEFSGAVSMKMPLNPDTGVPFKNLEEANAWAAAAILKMDAEILASGVKRWTPYKFMSTLPSATMAGIIQLEDQGDIQTKIALKMWVVAQDIKADDPNLIAILDYWISKGILTPEQKNNSVKYDLV